MDIDAAQEHLLEDIVKLAASRKRAFKPITVLIDGPSGSGKTWTSAALADRTHWRVVHLDEFYPGWHGLEKGSEMVGEQVLRTMNPGYWRWDWESNCPGDWASLDVRDDLIVEGVGSVTADNIAAAKKRGAVVTVRIDGPREQRYERAIAREPAYEKWFTTWEEQEKSYFSSKAGEPDLAWEWR
ncbi:hypothetical protein GWO58_05640 [Corynebacterium macginleyi]|uniref:hypothetical protein n=1 Tax=Corynebacterium macginleyi TaxID=38290 RepID=UPI00190E55A7|nr:hypothetical protein [Corynebacterium macginleyi]MBK4146299.1 hypothetical protein [Corynebacterium macginleyi]